MRKLLQDLFEKRLDLFVSEKRGNKLFFPKAERKHAAAAKRSAEIVKVKASGNIIEEGVEDEFQTVKYHAHYQYLIKQKDLLYLEEEMEVRIAKFYKGALVMDEEITTPTSNPQQDQDVTDSHLDEPDHRISYSYNRLKAVQYAERWWNTHNPAFKSFENNCTNYISQCLRAGEAPMRGHPNRGNGWWYQYTNWSYSWAVAHSLKNYLGNSKNGLRAREVSSPDQLILGDIICYDFEGDGRFNHNTIVTGKDANGMPLVNANTYNSRMRYWAYEDSTAYTPNIKYKFYAIIDE
ncbi:amidase domain-containing protein [Neobacillus sp. MM2021_6]|uniref:amidase domain-containing protein n=1 Tax=Bacillaceae TaxID=186817 RepID=UPI00140E552E|nr:MULTISPECIES: amidase domain-containing protein [Bacillaceae]MBO0962833.1 amidase domain-containing protein [Neobacillus sp. MM2021_6]NHC20984.1 amidase domain-containing protein [Bacillus sp. MM2020_4]